ncbi:type II toxin-antitoxin system VapC family toxin [Amycolatopsis panacis]|uniref:Ribonuclease VapC n=1 Tax=Amycolatopsis panacis TaxID=2340917 RepID=A0A419I412_9PSEU|nr:type II toxin-antitoxin system VapC family toxin [Amycolatopsis panacis]RJQ85006.1 type II toxin-antitoxin system VapC family toxin [Amycolatopsis panacis]
MIIDTSALVAIINREPESAALEQVLVTDTEPKIGAPTRTEAGIVLLAKFGMRGRSLYERFLQEWNVSTIPFESRHAEIAIEAFQRFGKGRHAARLNLGDCHSYATAKIAGEPLLCIGDDFPQTDLPLIELNTP